MTAALAVTVMVRYLIRYTLSGPVHEEYNVNNMHEQQNGMNEHEKGGAMIEDNETQNFSVNIQSLLTPPP